MELNGTTGIIFCISFNGFGKVFLQKTICFLRGDKFYPASAPSHALGAQCSKWNVDYRIHPTLFHSRFKLCRTIFENQIYICCVNIWFLLLKIFKYQNYYHHVIKIKTIN